MKYFKTSCNKLILQDNNDIYFIKTQVEKNVYELQKPYIDTLGLTKITKPVFYKLLNLWFKKVKHEWFYKGNKFKRGAFYAKGDSPDKLVYHQGNVREIIQLSGNKITFIDGYTDITNCARITQLTIQ